MTYVTSADFDMLGTMISRLTATLESERSSTNQSETVI